MPGKVKVRILAARNLPVMDRSSDTTDAFAEVKLADVTFKTDVCRKTLHPSWNSDWYRFDVDDCDLQDEPLQIRIMDYDTYSANDAIGKVYIDLNPLLLKADNNRVSTDGQKQIMLSGWLPIFDTMHGVRGEVNVQVKVELFSDLNKFRTSSCGVLFFCTNTVPEGYRVKCINGFVEKLVINDDPEYQWIDKIRTPRASNEARQTLFMKLSSTVQRKIGLMALELGANAVLGYKQFFDLEGDTGIVVRGIGTAVTLSKLPEAIDTRDVIRPEGRSMADLIEHVQRVFQNLSMPWAMENVEKTTLIGTLSPTGVGLVSSLTAAAASFGRTLASSPSSSSSWLSRKSSFKAAARTFRSVSVTTMKSRSPAASNHHRVASIKSAKASIMRKGSESESFTRRFRKESTSSPYPGGLYHSSTNSSINTSASQDVTSPSMPALELEGHAVFDLSLSDEEASCEDSSDGCESLKSEEESMPSAQGSSPHDDEISSKASSDNSADTDWVKHARRMRLEQGRVDSTTTNEVTYINTMLNKSLTVTDEGNAIRRRIAADDSPRGSAKMLARQLSEDATSSSATLDPPILTIEPPSPMPTSASPFLRNFHESDSETNTTLNSVVCKVLTNIRESSPTTSSSLKAPSASTTDSGGANVRRRRIAVVDRKVGHKSSHSFNSIRDRRRRPRTRSDDRSSSEPPLLIDNINNDNLIVVEDSQNTNIIIYKPTPISPKQPTTSNRRLLDAAAGSSKSAAISPAAIAPGAGGSGGSRHASGESDVVAGCSPKAISSAMSFHLANNPYTTPTARLPATKGILARDGPDILEFPFLTLHVLPEGFVQRIGGLVCCRSVKLLEGELENNRTQRENWWQEIRHEIRSHARCLGCNLVVGYTEETSIWDDLVVLSASGTAVVGNLNFMLDLESVGLFGPPFLPLGSKPSSANAGSARTNASATQDENSNNTCSLLHIMAGETGLPFTWRVNKCHACGKHPVPDVLFTTIEPPVSQLAIAGRGCLLLAKVVRAKKDLKGESNAKEISDALPFIEYELHRQLLNKLKVKGMNAIFGLKMCLSISDKVMVAMAMGTGVHLTGLAAPTPPKLVHHRDDKEYLRRMQRRLEEKISENMTYHGISDESRRRSMSIDDDEELELEGDTNALMDNDPMFGNKETCVLEIDDTEDADILESILDNFPPPGVTVFSTEELVGISSGHFVRTSQMFTQVWRGRIHPSTKDLTRICQRLLSSIYFKLRRLKPCLVSKLQIKADLDDENELQLTVSGMAIALAHGGKTRDELSKELACIDNAESDSLPSESSCATSQHNKLTKAPIFYIEAKAPEGVMLTQQSYICGARIEKYLGNLNFFLIRETSSLREAGGLNSFVQSFICEIHAIMRAHVLALGGNALISYFMSEFVVMHNPHKNQAQCLIHVGGDAVQAQYISS